MRITKYMLAAVPAIFLLAAANSANAVTITTICPLASDVDTDPSTVAVCFIPTFGTISDVNVALALEDTDDPTGSSYVDNLVLTLSHDGADVVVYDGDADTPSAVMDAEGGDETDGHRRRVGIDVDGQSLRRIGGKF